MRPSPVPPRPRLAGAALAAALLLALPLAGCVSPAQPDEAPRPRAPRDPGPGILAPEWMEAMLPSAPVPAAELEERTAALKSSPRATVRVEGHSVQGRPLLGVFLAEGEPGGKPTVFLTGSQHGNEPSGSDAAVLLATYYAWGGDEAKAILDEVNIYVLVCANPDGREADTRGNADEVDVNRDHMNLATPEGRAIHAAYHRVDPAVILDLHQFGSPPVDVPATPLSAAIIFEVAAVQNPLAYPGIVAASHDLEAVVLEGVAAAFGPGSASSYPPTQSSQDSSIHRNHYGMHNSLSLLFEARVGLAEYATEVRLHIVAAQAVLAAVAADPRGALAAKAEAEHESSANPPPARGYAAPPQAGLEALHALLRAHGLDATLAEADLAATSLHYDPAASGGEALRTSFPAGTLVVPTAQPDWRTAVEMFESSSAKDASYTAGPRDAGVDAWRLLG